MTFSLIVILVLRAERGGEGGRGGEPERERERESQATAQQCLFPILLLYFLLFRLSRLSSCTVGSGPRAKVSDFIDCFCMMC